MIHGEYQRIEPNEDGILQSVVFPGLWLDAEAFFNQDIIQLQAVLQAGLQSPEHAAVRRDVTTSQEGVKLVPTIQTMPLLESGMRLTSREEFLRRWDALPNVKNAELIGRSRVIWHHRVGRSSWSIRSQRLDSWMDGLCTFCWQTPGVERSLNRTCHMADGPTKQIPQPDQSLWILHGVRRNNWRPIDGALTDSGVLEFGHRSVGHIGDNQDLRQKSFKLYEACWRTRVSSSLRLKPKQEIHWHCLNKGKYQRS